MKSRSSFAVENPEKKESAILCAERPLGTLTPLAVLLKGTGKLLNDRPGYPHLGVMGSQR